MRILNAILFALGAALLGYLIWRVGPGQLGREMRALGWGLVPFALSEGLAEFIHGIGWRHCLSGPHRSLSLVQLFRIRMAGYSINYLTPSAALGGEVTKAVLLASNQRGPEAVTGVLIGKLCFAFAHLLFVVAGSLVILYSIPLPPVLWGAMFVGSALVASGMIAFLLIQKHGKLGAVVRWLVSRKLGGRFLREAAGRISTVDEALKLFYRERPLDLLKAVCWHQLGYSLGIAQTWFFFHLLNSPTSWAVAAGIWFLGMWFDLVTFAVPLNLGTLEASRILALRALGHGPLIGMTYGVALRLAQLFWSAFGLVAYGWLLRQAARLPQVGKQKAGAFVALACAMVILTDF